MFEALVVITLESVLFAKFRQRLDSDFSNNNSFYVDKTNKIKKSMPPTAQDGLTKGIPVYLSIFIFSLIFQVALAWDAVSHLLIGGRRSGSMCIYTNIDRLS